MRKICIAYNKGAWYQINQNKVEYEIEKKHVYQNIKIMSKWIYFRKLGWITSAFPSGPNNVGIQKLGQRLAQIQSVGRNQSIYGRLSSQIIGWIFL